VRGTAFLFNARETHFKEKEKKKKRKFRAVRGKQKKEGMAPGRKRGKGEKPLHSLPVWTCPGKTRRGKEQSFPIREGKSKGHHGIIDRYGRREEKGFDDRSTRNRMS